ncbi:MAG: ABC transporter substrate-binding protein [Candidatus Bathyarchaeia archaeon]
MKYQLGKYFLATILAALILNTFVVSSIPFAKAQENILRIAFDCIPSTFNPLLSMRDICQSVWFGGLLYEPLILNLFNGSLVPWLAKRWEILDNGTRYVFYIDERAKWSDGKPVTAYDVEYTWNLTMTYAFPSALRDVLLEVKAVNNYTVEFITSQPWARWYSEFGGTAVLPKHIWEQVADPLSYEFIDDPSKHVTSSAFIYDSFKAGEWWLFRKRQNYWKTESMPKIDGILLRYVSDFSLYPFMLQRGDVDITLPFPFYLLGQIVGKPNIEIWTFPVPVATEVLAVNTRLYPLNLREVRQAIDLAIDKIEIANFYFMGYGMPANRCLVNMAYLKEFYVPEAAWLGWGKTKEERIAEANRILDELGFTKGSDGIRVTPNGTRLSFKFIIQMAPLTTVRLRVSEAIVGYLREIGIEISQYQPLAIMDFFMQAFLASQKDWGFAEGTYGEYPEPWYNQVYSYLLPPVGLPQVMATGFDETEPEICEMISNLSRSALRRLNYADLVEDVKQIIRIYKDYVPTICIAFYPLWIWAYRTDRLTNWKPEIATKWGAFGYPQPMRPLVANELIPAGWKPPETPTETPRGLSIEQIIVIAVVVVIVVAAVSYIAIRARRRAK